MSQTKAKMPGGISYIIGNEAAERFSYYGMRAILVIFMTKYLVDANGAAANMTGEQAKVWYHTFSMAVYAFPIIGALISDILWGKYKTIMSLSVVYCLGHLSLAFMDISATTALMPPKVWLGLGLGLIAVGSGGIKPCVSAHVGDQFDASNKTLLDKIFSYFYFSINLGAFVSSLATPFLLSKYGPAVAFGVPGLLMFIATFFFWLGKTKFIAMPSVSEKITRKAGGKVTEDFTAPLAKVMAILIVLGGAAYFGGMLAASGVLALLFIILMTWSKPKEMYADQRKGTKEYFKEVFSKQGLKALGGLGILYIFIAAFWSLFDQTGSSWVLQADNMNRWVDLRFGPFQQVWLNFELLPSQIQAVNPILILLFIPLFNMFLYPMANKVVKLTPLRKIGFGFFVSAASFAVIAMVESRITAGGSPTILWQFLAYAILTAGEVMISITALEFSYTQAPNNMKSIIMGVYLLSVSLGNFITAAVNKLIQNADGTVALEGASYYWFFVALIVGAGILFAFFSRNYQEENYIQDHDDRVIEDEEGHMPDGLPVEG